MPKTKIRDFSHDEQELCSSNLIKQQSQNYKKANNLDLVSDQLQPLEDIPDQEEDSSGDSIFEFFEDISNSFPGVNLPYVKENHSNHSVLKGVT